MHCIFPRDRPDDGRAVEGAAETGAFNMSDNYIPRADKKAVHWYRGFRNAVAEDPARFGLMSGDVAAMDDVLLPLEQAFREMPAGGKYPALTARKDGALGTCENLMRTYAMIVKSNLGVADESKILVGIRPKNIGRSRIPCPTTAPAVKVVSATQGVHTLIYFDPENGGAKRKPRGARALELFVAVRESSVIELDPQKCNYYGAFTRSPIGVQFNAAQNGMQATYRARWSGSNGRTGPWSSFATMTICA